MTLRILLYPVLLLATAWASAHLTVKSYPENPPMGPLTSRYSENFSLAATWPFYYKYYLYVPQGYTGIQDYPLVVLLHGVSRHMRGGSYILDKSIQQKHPSFVLVPIAPKGLTWQSEKRYSSGSKLAFDAIEDVQSKFRIDRNRIYLSGYSMGGTGTFAMLEDYPDTFAAALALCGVWSPSRAKLFPDNIPIVAAHGSEDNPETSRNMISALQKAGKVAKYMEYPGIGHNVWDYVYTDPQVWDWLFSQQRKATYEQ